IDEMAQYEMMRQKWVGTLSMTGDHPHTVLRVHGRDGRSAESPRDDWMKRSLDEAARMVERLQRLYHTALRTLMSLRRRRRPFIVEGPGQVNVAMGPQLNVGTATAVSEPRSS